MSKIVGIDMGEYKDFFDTHCIKTTLACCTCGKVTGKVIRMLLSHVMSEAIIHVCKKCFTLAYIDPRLKNKDLARLGNKPFFKIKNVKVVCINE